MIPRCPVCNSLAGTSRTAAGKRMWCTARGCMWSAVMAEEELTGRDMCAVGHYLDTRHATTPGLHLESDAQKDYGQPGTSPKNTPPTAAANISPSTPL